MVVDLLKRCLRLRLRVVYWLGFVVLAAYFLCIAFYSITSGPEVGSAKPRYEGRLGEVVEGWGTQQHGFHHGHRKNLRWHEAACTVRTRPLLCGFQLQAENSIRNPF